MSDDLYRQLKIRYDELQLRVSQFAATEQKLIDTRYRLERELARFESIQRYSSRLIASDGIDAFAQLAAEAVETTFDVEIGALWLRGRGARLESPPTAISNAAAAVPWQPLGDWLARHGIGGKGKSETDLITFDGGAPEDLPGISRLIACPIRDAQGDDSGAIIGLVTEGKRLWYDTPTEDFASSFTVFTQLLGTLLQNRAAHAAIRELHTPLESILSAAELLGTNARLQGAGKENVRDILRASRRLVHVVQEALVLSRVDSGRLVVNPEPVELREILDDCLALASPLAEQHSVRLESAPHGDAIVHADRLRTKQAVLNLLSNAIKYNGARGQVRVETSEPDHAFIRIAVVDTGPGIPAERFDELYLPFNRLGAEHGSVAGAGIGLAFTRRVVEMMNGRIGVTSRAGNGSRFYIDLPRVSRYPAPP